MLFNAESAEYFAKQLWEKLIDLQSLDAELVGVGVGDERTQNVHTQRDIKLWLSKQLSVLDEKLGPFLRLGH